MAYRQQRRVTSAAATEAAATATGLKVAHGEAETPAAPAAAAEADPDGTAHEDSEGPPHWAEWKLGVALAGASFEAYGGLSEPGLPDRTLTGAEIRYTDREFLRTKMAGLLQVTIQRATALPAADPSPFSSDPYLTVVVGDSTYMTHTVLNNLSPEWHERCTLLVRDPAAQSVTVRVMGEDGSTTDDYLGSAAADLGPLCDGQEHRLQLDLKGSEFAGGGDEDGRGSSSGGSVHLTCHFLPFEEVLAGDAVLEIEGQPLLAKPGEIPLAAEWRSLMELAGVATHALYTPFAFIENTATNTQAWLYWNTATREACVAFRGTEQGSWRDILTDLHLVPAPMDPDRVATAPMHAALADVSAPPQEPGPLRRIIDKVERAKEQVAAERQQAEEEASSGSQAESSILGSAMDAVTSTAEDLKAVLDRVRAEIEAGEEHSEADLPWVHSGFITAFDSVRPAVLSLLAAMLAGEREQWRLMLTGHSLGGALATLCAWDCAHRKWAACEQPPELIVYSFGAPRVGNRSWADHYNRLVPSTWRIVNERDTVATVPRLMGYAHVGHSVTLKGDGQVEVHLNTTERFGEGLGLPDLTPAVGAVVAAKVPEMRELLPDAATKALQKVGIEVAAAGSTDKEAAAAEEAAASLDAASRDAAEAAAAAVSPEALPDLWEQEMEAWSLLLDGSALNEHMEPLYLENLRGYLQTLAEEGQEQLRQLPISGGDVSEAAAIQASADSEHT